MAHEQYGRSIQYTCRACTIMRKLWKLSFRAWKPVKSFCCEIILPIPHYYEIRKTTEFFI